MSDLIFVSAADIYDVLHYVFLLFLIAYWVYVARKIDKDRKRRRAEWEEHLEAHKALEECSEKLNTEWKIEIDTWRMKREKLEAAINDRDLRGSDIGVNCPDCSKKLPEDKGECVKGVCHK